MKSLMVGGCSIGENNVASDSRMLSCDVDWSSTLCTLARMCSSNSSSACTSFKGLSSFNNELTSITLSPLITPQRVL